MSKFFTVVKDWGRDPDTIIALKKSGKVAALSGTCCLCGGILFGPAAIGVSAIAFGISYYMIDMYNFGSAVFSLANFLKNDVPEHSSSQDVSASLEEFMEAYNLDCEVKKQEI